MKLPTTRFIAEFGRPGFMSHVVDQEEQTKNGKGIIASCHSQHWADVIATTLNATYSPLPAHKVKKEDADHDV